MKEEFDKDHENLTKIEKHGTKIDRIFDNITHNLKS